MWFPLSRSLQCSEAAVIPLMEHSPFRASFLTVTDAA